MKRKGIGDILETSLLSEPNIRKVVMGNRRCICSALASEEKLTQRITEQKKITLHQSVDKLSYGQSHTKREKALLREGYKHILDVPSAKIL